MKRTPIKPALADFPAVFRPYLDGTDVYDSSCSPEARVFYIDRDGGLFLKRSAAGTLKGEAEMASYFHRKGLGAQILSYHTEDDCDWLLSCRVAGEDCTNKIYLDDPKRLCDTIAEHLRALHEIDVSECPVQDHTARYLATAERNYRNGCYDLSLFPSGCEYANADEAWARVQRDRHLLKNEVLLHGDYCLPNIMLDNWRLSGFIDLGNGGVGDRHVDLFWGAWTLCFNLKTDRYCARFLDAYGRDRVEEDKLSLIAACEVFG